jgi:high-affinity nickel permease
MHSINFLSVVALGFFLGMRHATDPDHVIAVSTIVSRSRRVGQAAWIGILWGVGHTLTIVVVGSGIIVFGWVIPTRLGLSMEFSVALMLVLLGVLNLTGMMQRINEIVGARVPFARHEHTHADARLSEHDHPEQTERQASLSWFDRQFAGIGVYRLLRPLIVGLVHGLAGSAAVALLVLAAIRDARWAIAYLFVFGVGTIAGMMLITMAMAAPLIYSGRKFARLGDVLRIASGAISLAFGLFLIYEIGFVNGLFTSHPNWTPH